MALVGGIFCTARIFKYRVNIIEILNTLRKEMDKMTNSIAIYYVNISAESCLKSSGALHFLLTEVLMDFSGRYIIKTWFMACGKNLTTKRTSLR